MIDRFANMAPEERSARGRRTILDDAELERLWQMRREGKTLAECAAEFSVHRATIMRYITKVRKEKLEKLRASLPDRLSAVAK